MIHVYKESKFLFEFYKFIKEIERIKGMKSHWNSFSLHIQIRTTTTRDRIFKGVKESQELQRSYKNYGDPVSFTDGQGKYFTTPGLLNYS